ncbi:MAG TPA: ABC transporter permease, partial [Coriobacteriia bacterium]
MARFLVRRVALGVLVLWLISILVFAIFFIAPPDVARALAGRQATPQTIELINHRLGLDRPLLVQYATWISHLLHGDLGYSYYHQQPVTTIIAQDLPVTLSLAFGAAIIWLVIGVFNGVMSAIHPRTLLDRGLTGFALFFYSMPTFLLGLLFLYFFYFRLTVAGFDFFPAGGYVPFTQSPYEWARHLILPWFALALVSAAVYTRLTRGSMLDVLGEDYIRTARAKGLSERRVTYRHALRSASTPLVTQFGIDLGALVGGAVITETVFSLGGIGQASIVAINQQDLP